jgi:hypothetical protein
MIATCYYGSTVLQWKQGGSKVQTTVMAEAVARLFVRLPADLHDPLVAWAREEGRSLNNLIVYVLRRALADRRAA